MRWTLDLASNEFGIHRQTLAKRVLAESIQPGDDGKFSTAQIIQARFGSKEEKELLKLDKETEKLEITNGKASGKLIELSVVEQAWEQIVILAKTRLQIIPNKVQSRLGLSEEALRVIEQEIDEALDEISKAPDYKPERPEEALEEDG